MVARLGRMTELDALLKSIEGRVFIGSSTERITGAREGLSNMQTHPEFAFRCGPLALHQIKLLVDPQNPGTDLIHASKSTQQGFLTATGGGVIESARAQLPDGIPRDRMQHSLCLPSRI